MRIEIELRVLPRFRVMDYLTQAGGEITETWCVAGPGWEAFIESLEPDRVGIVDIPRDRLVIEGEDRKVESVAAFMQRKVQQMRREGSRRKPPQS